MLTSGMTSSARTDWETPEWLFRELDAEFRFTLDVCASESNAKCPDYFDIARCGLRSTWSGVCWMNPPYGRTIGDWVERAHRAAATGEADRVVCLLPSRTDTAWFHRYVLSAAEMRFISGRLYFGDGDGRAPFPSVIVVFGPGGAGAPPAIGSFDASTRRERRVKWGS